MPLFFFLSGFLFKESSTHKPISYIYKKIKSLYFPYIKWGIIFLLLHNIFCTYHILKEPIYQPIDYLNALIELLKMQKSGILLGAFWFLKELLCVSTLTIIIFFIIYHFKFSKQIVTFIIPISLLIAVFMSIGNIHLLTISHRTFLGMSFFISGYLYYKKNIQINIISFVIFSLIILGGAYLHPTHIASNRFDIILAYVLAIIGIFAILYIATYIEKTHKLKIFLIYTGQNTISIMALHFLSFKIISLLKIAFYNLKIEKLGDWPIIKECNDVYWILYSIAGVFIPLLYTFLLSNLKKQYENYSRCWRTNL